MPEETSSSSEPPAGNPSLRESGAVPGGESPGGAAAASAETSIAEASPPAVAVPERIDLQAFQKHSLVELYEVGMNLGLRVGGSRSKHQLVFEICTFYGRRGTVYDCSGVVEVTRDGYGFVRDPIYSFLPQPDDVYISPGHIRRYGLRTGNFVRAVARAPREKESFLSIETVVSIEDIPAEQWQPPKPFDKLTALFPRERIILENSKTKGISTRVIDIAAPLGKGQRALICAPPRGGKTILLKEMAVSIRKNHPEIELMVVLVDERPEEVTDFRETIDSVVYASTFDQTPERHSQVAEVVMERARRLVEMGRDVVILLDSLTRLTRGYNNMIRGKQPTDPGRAGSRGARPRAKVLRFRPQGRGGWQPDRGGHGAYRDREPDGRGDLRGIQGNRKHGGPARSRNGRAPDFPGHQHAALGHAERRPPLPPGGVPPCAGPAPPTRATSRR